MDKVGGGTGSSVEVANSARDEFFMHSAIEQARIALSVGEVPVGATLVVGDEIISSAHNLRESKRDPTAHAETIALRTAAERLSRWRLSDCTLYVTLEPCLMCAGALINSRIKRVVFGPFDPKAGALGSLYNIGCDPRLNHELAITSRVLEEISSKLLREFFATVRSR